MQYSFPAVEQVIVMTVCIIASHHELILASLLKPSRKNLHFLKLAKTGSCRFYSGNRINQLQFFLACAVNRTKPLVKSICETAPKSLSWLSSVHQDLSTHLDWHCQFANQVEGKFEMHLQFVESDGGQGQGYWYYFSDITNLV